MAELSLAVMWRFLRATHSRCLPARSCALVLGALCMVLNLLSAGFARAQDALEVTGYREAVAEALAEYEAQNYLEARTLFERAHKLYPNARTLRGLAIVAFELRNYSDSVLLLEQALASKRKALEGEMRVDSQRLLERARGFVAELTIMVTPTSAEVRIDGGRPAAGLDKSLMLDIGSHVLEFSADGFFTEKRSYAVHGGERDTWNVSLKRKFHEESKGREHRQNAPLRRWQKGLGIAAVGLGAAAVVTAGLLTLVRRREGDRYRRVSPDDGEYPQAVKDWVGTRSGPYIFAGLGAVTLGAGGLGLILGAPKRRLTATIAAGFSGVGGIALTALAISNMRRGSQCGASLPDRPRCSDELEQLDRGAIFALTAAPLVAISLAQLFRKWPEAAGVSALALLPRIDPTHAAASINLTGMFL